MFGSPPPPAPPPPPSLPPINRRSWLLGGGLIVLVVVVLLAGLAFYRGIGSGDVHGADTPEAAAAATLAALDTNDLVRALELTPPAERVGLVPLVRALSGRASDLGLQESDNLQAGLSGLSFRTEDTRMSVRTIRDDLAKVEFRSGRMRVEADPDQVNPVARQRLLDDTLHRESAVLDTDDLTGHDDRYDPIDPFLMAVRDGNEWFVSPFYTALQYAAEANGYAPRRDPSAADGRSFDSPEDAAAAFVRALADAPNGRSAALAETVSPYEARAIDTYPDLIDDEMRSEFGGPQASVGDLSFDVEPAGKHGALVKPDRLEFSSDAGDSSFGADLCLTPGRHSDVTARCFDHLYGLNLDRAGLIAVDDDGWRISLSASMLGLASSAVADSSPEALALLLGNLEVPGAWLIPPANGELAVGSTTTLPLDRELEYRVYHEGPSESAYFAFLDLTGVTGRQLAIDVRCADCDAMLARPGYEYTDLDSSDSGATLIYLPEDGERLRLVLIADRHDEVTVSATEE